MSYFLYTCAKKLKQFILDVFRIQLCYFLYWQNISNSLFVKYFYFSVFCNIFFYTQLVFVFHLLRDYYLVSDCIVTLCFSLFLKGFRTSHELYCEVFLYFFRYYLADEFLDFVINKERFYFAPVISQRYIKYTLVYSSKRLAYLFYIRLI